MMPDYISILMFADNVVLLAESEQCLIDAVNEWCVNNQMSINVKKLKLCMYVNLRKLGLNFNLRVVFQI